MAVMSRLRERFPSDHATGRRCLASRPAIQLPTQFEVLDGIIAPLRRSVGYRPKSRSFMTACALFGSRHSTAGNIAEARQRHRQRDRQILPQPSLVATHIPIAKACRSHPLLRARAWGMQLRSAHRCPRLARSACRV